MGVAARLAVSFALLAATSVGVAQSHPEYLPLGPAKGALYRPDSGPAPHVGVLVMHRTADFMKHAPCTELSRRGMLVLCMNSRFENNEVAVSFETLPLDVKAGVLALRAQPGIKSVLLFGHSGGGPLMSLYQAVAENGPAYCQGSNKLVVCNDDLASLPPADGLILADAHPGNAILVLRSLNPSVASEDLVGPPISALDPYDARNGFNPSGASRYSTEFRKAYFAAQSERMNRQIAMASGKLERIRDGRYPYPDNDVITIAHSGPPGSGPGATAFLWITDPAIPEIMSTTRPQKLVRNDGSVEASRVVTSVAVPDPTNGKRNIAFETGTRVFSLRSFLSANAIRSRNSIDDIDYCSSNNSTVCAVQSVKAPTLFMAMGAYYFIRDNERLYDLSKSSDKEFAVIEGATHFFLPCTACEPSPGAYSNTMKNLFDYIAAWTGKRY